ncbi:MAG: hypothetical protein BroJett040_25700 [Oligoflexia bacterium]|nr:MAG: hypothetical protein BroJett040_25700 [Oligoflexia bacterium]
MAQSLSKPDSLYELGKLYSDRGDFFLAIDKLKEAATFYLSDKNLASYLKSANLLLRLYAETNQQDEIFKMKETLQDLVIKEGVELSSRTYYTLALCASYKGQQEVALDYLQKSLTLALSTDNKEDICYAIYGTAAIYRLLGKYQEALKEIYNLQIFFQVLDLPELKTSTLILNAMILREMKRFDEAIQILWQAHDLIKSQKAMWMHIYMLGIMGQTYLRMGEKDMARMYLTLAHRSIDPKNLVRFAGEIEKELQLLGDDGQKDFDIVFDLEKHTVVEKKLGQIDFKNQFILLDLLRLFIQNQGQVYSKEYLVEHVWKQQYDPTVHDNKIYVTIKRLRKMIEPDYEKPKYIFRAKNGYFMNKSARIHMESRGGEV